MRNPTLCGKNRLYIPESGCSDCDELAYRIDRLEERLNAFVPMTEEQIEALTPIECLEPEGASGIVCQGEACLSIVCNDTSEQEEIVPIEEQEGEYDA